MKVFKIVTPLGLSSAAVACIVLLLRNHIQYKGIVEDLSSWSSFFGVFGVVYAIVTGFLLVTVLNRYSALSHTIEDELNAIESIRDFLVYLDDQQHSAKSAMQQALAHYTMAFATTEWEAMTAPSLPMNSDTSEELYDVMRRSNAFQVNQERDSITFAALVETISELAKIRTRRIALANDRLPPRLRILMIFMSIMLVGALVLLGVRGAFIHVFMLVTLTVSIHLLFMVVEDLDHPFYGVWNINRGPLDALVKRFDEALGGSVPGPNHPTS